MALDKNDIYELQPKSALGIITHHFINHEKIRRHWHEHLEIIFLLGGNASLLLDEKQYSAKANDIIIINSSVVHESTFLSSENEYYVFMFPQSYFNCMKDGSVFEFDSVVSGDDDCTGLMIKAAKLLSSAEAGSEYLLHSILYSLLYRLSQDHARRTSTDLRPLDELSEKVKKRIEESYFDSLSIEDFANEFSVSISHLQHVFKERVGTGITDYLNRVRIENSLSFLCNRMFSISEAASRVGFSDYNYFSRVFKKYKGMSPSQYRKRNAGEK